MKLKEIYIQNYRGIKDLHLKLDSPTTILIGENNTGKTTILEALKIVLNRQRVSKGNIFSEYDYHCENSGDGLDKEILIELWFKEDETGKWDEDITSVELNGIAELDPNNNLFSLGIRLKSTYNQEEKTSIPSWYWLRIDRSELGEINTTHTAFFKIVQFFYLNALRDANASFSGHSQFWKQFLKLDLTTEQESDFTAQLQTINDTILSSDPKVEQLKNRLDEIPNVVSNDVDKVSIQAFSDKPWDLSAKAKLFITTKGSQIELPIERFGQGTQSLSVLMLFKAYAEVLMQRNTHEHAFSIIGLEEPEVHLYPQAVRSLWNFLQTQLPQQKIISTHSTFFIQEADLTSLKLLKRRGNNVKLFYIKRAFEVQLPKNDDLINFCTQNNEEFSFISIGTTGTLTLNRALSDAHFSRLKSIYTGDADALQALNSLKNESSFYLSDDDLLDLKYYTERIRGEIFFAKAWLLCEGQTEYLLLRYFAELMGKNLDRQGVSVIDYKNNGSAGLFIVLAKHFDMPWRLISDSDTAYQNTVSEIRKRKIPQSDIDSFVETFPNTDTDIETFLYDKGFKDNYLDVLSNDLIFHQNVTTITVGKIDKKTNAKLFYKNDNTFVIKIKVANNTTIELQETDSHYVQLYQQILKKKNKTEEDINTLKTGIDFSTQSEKEILEAKVANINQELKLEQGQTPIYSINLSIHGKVVIVDNMHSDYEELLRLCTIALIKKNKILHTQKLIRNLQEESATDSKVPQFFKDLINDTIPMT